MGSTRFIAQFLALPFLALTACGSNTPDAPNEQPDAGTVVPDTGPQPDVGVADVRPDFDPGGDAPVTDAPVDKPYPAPPYGYNIGNTLENYKFLGWTNPVTVGYQGELEPIELADFYDPDGTKGIKALFINASAVWCVVCKFEQADIASEKLIWEPKGVRFLETLFENGDQSGPADLADLSKWASDYSINWNLVLDPANQFSPFFDTTATPMNMIVDTKTMQIVDIITGAPDPTWWQQTLGPIAP